MKRPYPTTLQELPPRWAHLCLDVEGFVLSRINGQGRQPDPSRKKRSGLSGLGLVLACSGGSDSTALLHMLACLRSRSGFKLVAVHLDHGLRKESSEDARFVAARCGDLGVAFVSERVDVGALAREQGMGIEEAGRLARYTLLERVREEFGFHYSVTAHHLNDLTEDVLMRLMRGTGWPGLAGMPAFDEKRCLLRPLLLTPESDLLRFLADLEITWREDETNQSDSMLRNRVRHTIVPMIIEENPSFPSAVARLWNQGALDQDYWECVLAEAPVIRTEQGAELRQVDLMQMHPSIRMRLYKMLLDELGAGQVLAQTLFDMDAGVTSPRTDKAQLYQFPGDKVVRLKGGRLLFRHEGDLEYQPHPPLP